MGNLCTNDRNISEASASVPKSQTKVEFVEIHFPDHTEEEWGWGHSEEPDNLYVSHLKAGGFAENNGVKLGWRISKINDTYLNADNYETFSKLKLEGGIPCVITFAFQEEIKETPKGESTPVDETKETEEKITTKNENEAGAAEVTPQKEIEAGEEVVPEKEEKVTVTEEEKVKETATAVIEEVAGIKEVVIEETAKVEEEEAPKVVVEEEAPKVVEEEAPEVVEEEATKVVEEEATKVVEEEVTKVVAEEVTKVAEAEVKPVATEEQKPKEEEEAIEKEVVVEVVEEISVKEAVVEEKIETEKPEAETATETTEMEPKEKAEYVLEESKPAAEANLSLVNQASWIGEWSCPDNSTFADALKAVKAVSWMKSKLITKVTIKYIFEALGEDGFTITNQTGQKNENVVHGAKFVAPAGKLFGEGNAEVTFEEGNVITIVNTTAKYVITMRRYDNNGRTHKMSFKFEVVGSEKSSECVLDMNLAEAESSAPVEADEKKEVAAEVEATTENTTVIEAVAEKKDEEPATETKEGVKAEEEKKEIAEN